MLRQVVSVQRLSPETPMMQLTKRQEAFARAYLEIGNARQAYAAAGYSQKNSLASLLHFCSGQLLQNLSGVDTSSGFLLSIVTSVDGPPVAYQWSSSGDGKTYRAGRTFAAPDYQAGAK